MYRKRLDIAQKPARILKDCFAPTTRSCGTFCVRNKYGMREESEWYVGSVKLRTGANTGTEQTRLEEAEAQVIAPHLSVMSVRPPTFPFQLTKCLVP